MINVEKYAKAVEGALGMATMVGAGVLQSTAGTLPGPWLTAAQSAIATITVWRIWLVREEPAIDAAAAEAEQLVAAAQGFNGHSIIESRRPLTADELAALRRTVRPAESAHNPPGVQP
ncbi:hypothetical protein [Nocardia sp. NPDC046763]|uniref:hypothetical protein n=1 Tax=Nocardia sp. NPDC046763 TaxID=3155256 RepID=UPI0033CF5F44